jgi:carbon-monoxide dehydrogenase medium subunit
MKARNLRYVRPGSLQHAYRILEDSGGDAVPLAGGQSLLATLNMRLSAPKLLVDISDLKELTGSSRADGFIRLGALTPHRTLLESELVAKHFPLLVSAAKHIGHTAIRNRGTLGGSLAYADPAAELPACSVALDASLILGSRMGERRVKAGDFFKGLFETDLRPGELIIAVEFPEIDAAASAVFSELARRHGDFAIVGLAGVAKLDRDRIAQVRLVYFGCVDRAAVAKSVSAAVTGLPLPLRDHSFLAAAVRRDLAPDDTPGMRADTKLHLAAVLTRRALNSLSERAAA